DGWAWWGRVTEALSLEGDRCPNEAAGFSRLRRIDRLCHHASLFSRKLQRQDRGLTKLPQPWAGIPSGAASPPRRCAPSYSPAPPLRPAAAAACECRSPTDRPWSPSIAEDWPLPHGYADAANTGYRAW